MLGRSGDPRAVAPLTRAARQSPLRAGGGARARAHRATGARSRRSLGLLSADPATPTVRGRGGRAGRAPRRATASAYGAAQRRRGAARRAAPRRAAERRLVRALAGRDPAEQHAICRRARAAIGERGRGPDAVGLLDVSRPVAAGGGRGADQARRARTTRSCWRRSAAGGSARRRVAAAARHPGRATRRGCGPLASTTPTRRCASPRARRWPASAPSRGRRRCSSCLADANPRVVAGGGGGDPVAGRHRRPKSWRSPRPRRSAGVRRGAPRCGSWPTSASASALPLCVAGMRRRRRARARGRDRRASRSSTIRAPSMRCSRPRATPRRGRAPPRCARSARCRGRPRGSPRPCCAGSADADAWVRYYACQALGRLGYEARRRGDRARLTRRRRARCGSPRSRRCRT